LTSRLRSSLIITCVFVAAGALLLRSVSIAEPLGIDQSLWASAVRGLSRGQLLYHDVWEQRPPGIYWTYLAGFSVIRGGLRAQIDRGCPVARGGI